MKIIRLLLVLCLGFTQLTLLKDKIEKPQNQAIKEIDVEEDVLIQEEVTLYNATNIMNQPMGYTQVSEGSYNLGLPENYPIGQLSYVPASPGRITISTGSSGQSQIALYDENWNLLVMSMPGYGAHLEYELFAGQMYYIQISLMNYTYDITNWISFTISLHQHDNAVYSSKPATDSEMGYSNRITCTSCGNVISDGIWQVAKEGSYQFFPQTRGSQIISYVPSSSGVLTVYSSGDFYRIQGFLDNENFQPIIGDNLSASENNFRYEYQVEAGKQYYIAMTIYDDYGSNGYYPILFTIELQGHTHTPQDASITPTSATIGYENRMVCSGCGELIQEGQAVVTEGQYTVENNANQRIYYKFVPQKSGTICFYSTNQQSTNGYLYDQDMYIIDSKISNLENGDFKIQCEVKAGKVYYLEATYASNVQADQLSFVVHMHELVEIAQKDPTDTLLGNTYGLVCSKCGEVFEKSYSIIGHGSYIVETANEPIDYNATQTGTITVTTNQLMQIQYNGVIIFTDTTNVTIDVFAGDTYSIIPYPGELNPDDPISIEVEFIPEILFISGDVNEDEELDVLDAQVLEAYLNGLVILNQKQLDKADITMDERVDEEDVQMILDFVVGALVVE